MGFSTCEPVRCANITQRTKWFPMAADGLHFAEEYGQNSSLLAAHLASGAERDANLALLTGDLAYAL